MKQHITKKQWFELDKISKIKFVKAVNGKVPKGEKLGVTWTFKNDFRPSIGQMIEFLDEQWQEPDYVEKIGARIMQGDLFIDWPDDKELCDSLWQAVKEY